jgi:LL-diaminopimelate aminotransferase
VVQVNENYLSLQSSYLFVDIGRRVEAYQAEHPDIDVIKLGIGDVTLALPQAAVDAMHKAVDEMAHDGSFRGYGPEQGYEFLRQAIAERDFESRGVPITADEIFISDGAKCDTGNFQELFSANSRIAVADPVYPVYVDTNVMAGRAGDYVDGRYQRFVYVDATKENGFVPGPPDTSVDVVYLCFPNNPTGAVATKEQLQEWVDYAREHRALILFDAAYEFFIRDESLPHSIFEIDGAKECCVEFRSLSKTAGFTGTRCAYTIVPEECHAFDSNGNPVPLHPLWNRRQSTKFNGVSYPVQRAAEAVFADEGRSQAKELADYYLRNAEIIRNGMAEIGFPCVGGVNSPYIWVEAVEDSWTLFDRLLSEAGVVTTPGSGFGKSGEGYIRISAFNHRDKVVEATQRIRDALG